MNQTVVILDFGGQYKELIARRVRECSVYSIIKPYTTPIEEIRALNPIGIIFTGGPQSVYAPDAPACAEEVFHLGVPVLGICYGMQLICHMLGGQVGPCENSEYGTMNARFETASRLFGGMDAEQKVLMSHTDRVQRLPEGFGAIASTDLCPIAAFESVEKQIYGVQFHPEKSSDAGARLLRNFVSIVKGA